MAYQTITLSHDAFARQSSIRQVECGGECDWCGQRRTRHDKQTGAHQRTHTLYRYGTMPDDSGREHWHKGLFCSKSCHDSYHA